MLVNEKGGDTDSRPGTQLIQRGNASNANGDPGLMSDRAGQGSDNTLFNINTFVTSPEVNFVQIKASETKSKTRAPTTPAEPITQTASSQMPASSKLVTRLSKGTKDRS